MNRYGGGKSVTTTLYLSLKTFKKIVLGLTIFIALLTPHLGYASVIEVGPQSQHLQKAMP